MRESLIIHKLDDAELFVVPAIHYHQFFAHEVHRICADPDTRPEAVAVELGPQIAQEAGDWLRKLCRKKHKYGMLPVMLGITKINDLIRPSLREKAISLQQENRMDLSELPSDLLKQELDFASHSMLLLSPTDSIIEALRCGVELALPVFGVDLDDIAGYDHETVHMEVPFPEQDLSVYVSRNAPHVSRYRFDEIDLRREIAMAARLKALLKKYRRVLFTCGIGHWLSIRKLLDDPDLRPARIPEQNELKTDRFRRVLVHPSIAVQYMDMFPALTIAYEAYRRPATTGEREIEDLPPSDSCVLFYEQLEIAYSEYLKKSRDKKSANFKETYPECFRQFEAYLNNICLLDNAPVPGIFTALRASKEMVNEPFMEVLSNTMMEFPWASQDQFPDLPMVSPQERSFPGAVVLHGGTLPSSRRFHVRSYHPSSLHTDSLGKLPYRRKSHESTGWSSLSYTWVPWDRLVTALSLRATATTGRMRTGKNAVAFEGSLLGGIDVKKTLRAYARGEQSLYVRDTIPERSGQAGFMERFPVVWILDQNPDENAWLSAQFIPCDHIMPHVTDRPRLQRIMDEQGDNIVAVIGYKTRDTSSGLFASSNSIATDHLYGLAVLQPLCWTNKQHACWFEATGYNRNPVCSNTSFNNYTGSISLLYQERLGLNVREYHWSTVLILTALPYARGNITIVVPDGYQVEQIVHQKAHEYRVHINTVPLDHFSRTETNRMAICHFAQAMTTEPEYTFSKETEKIIGERQTEYLHLVPHEILEFGTR